MRRSRSSGRTGRLQRYSSELFGWPIDAGNPMSYGIVTREGNVNPEGVGIGGGPEPEGYGRPVGVVRSVS